jgi:endoglucanase
MNSLQDPSDKIIYEMHQYLDSDGSGKLGTCVSSTIGSKRLASATSWLRANGEKGILGEFADGPNSICRDAINGMLPFMVANKDVWESAM